MEHTLDHESRLSRIEALLEALNQRLDDAILTQLRDHGKRIRDLEDHISVMAETCARERGERQGSFDKAKLAKITAETIKIRQEGERKAWGIVDKAALDHTSSDGSLSQRPVDLSHLSPDELLRLTKEAFKTPDHE